MPTVKEFIHDAAIDMLTFLKKGEPLRPMQVDTLVEACERMRRALLVAEDKAPRRDLDGNVIFDGIPEFEARIQRINAYGGHASDWAREMALEFQIPIEKYQQVTAFLEDFACTKILHQPEARPAQCSVVFAVEPAHQAEAARNTSRVDEAARDLSNLGPDAMGWAREFAKMYGLVHAKGGNIENEDETISIMVGWFANAMSVANSAMEEKHAADTLDLRERNDRQADTIARFQGQTGVIRPEELQQRCERLEKANRELGESILQNEATNKHLMEALGIIAGKIGEGDQAAYSKGMTDRDPEIQTYQKEITDLKSRLEDQKTTNRVLTANIRPLEDRIEELKKKLLDQQAENVLCEKRITSLMDQLSKSGYSEGHQKGYKVGYAAGVRWHEATSRK